MMLFFGVPVFFAGVFSGSVFLGYSFSEISVFRTQCYWGDGLFSEVCCFSRSSRVLFQGLRKWRLGLFWAILVRGSWFGTGPSAGSFLAWLRPILAPPAGGGQKRIRKRKRFTGFSQKTGVLFFSL